MIKRAQPPVFFCWSWHLTHPLGCFFLLFFSHGHPYVSKDPPYNFDFKNLCGAKQNLTLYWPELYCMWSLDFCSEHSVKMKENKIKNGGNKCCVFPSHWTGTLFWNLTADWKLRNQWLLNRSLEGYLPFLLTTFYTHTFSLTLPQFSREEFLYNILSESIFNSVFSFNYIKKGTFCNVNVK